MPPVAGSIGIVRESTWGRRMGYGVESLRLNPVTGSDPPSYEPYQVFDYSTAATFDADDYDINEGVQLNENTMVHVQAGLAVCCPVFHAMMERIQARKRHAIRVLHHDVEHRNKIGRAHV